MLTNGEEAETSSNRGSFRASVDAHLLSHKCSEEKLRCAVDREMFPFPPGWNGILFMCIMFIENYALKLANIQKRKFIDASLVRSFGPPSRRFR